MSSHGSFMALGLGSLPGCSAPMQVQPPPFSTLNFFPPKGQPLSPLGEEDFFESFDGSFYDLTDILGPDLFEWGSPVPDPQLLRRIVSQVEFYLSDENLAKDAFLLKHVQKNKLGFVSIKLLTSFKKVKYLTRDWRVTLHALQFSERLEVNEEGTKVRRRIPIPESLLSVPPSKLLLAWNLLPLERGPLPVVQKSFIETVTKTFSPFGAITSIRILRPGKKLPSDMRKYSTRYPELLTKCCALVEYESLESARRAYEELSGGGTIKVIRLSGKGSKKKSGAEREEADEGELVEKVARQQPGLERLDGTTGETLSCSSLESDGASASPPVLLQEYLSAPAWSSSSLYSLGTSIKPCCFSSPYPSPLLTSKSFPQPPSPSPSVPKLGNGSSSSSPDANPEFRRLSDFRWDGGLGSSGLWVQRRRVAAQSQPPETQVLPCSALVPGKMPDSLSLRLGVMRLPHGPDGTKGFYNSIGRGKLVLRH